VPAGMSHSSARRLPCGCLIRWHQRGLTPVFLISPFFSLLFWTDGKFPCVNPTTMWPEADE
jgi:hypothetical protein